MRKFRLTKFATRILGAILVLAMALTSSQFMTLAYGTERDGDEVAEEAVEDETETSEEVALEEESEDVEEEEGALALQEIDPEEAEWTVFIYLCGSNLESDMGYATMCFDSLMKADYNDEVRYVIETGGSTEWQNSWVDPKKTQRFVIQGDSIELVYEDEILHDMGSPDGLRDFVAWGQEYFPSEKTMFQFWNHGGGAKGAEWDDNFHSDHLSVKDIADVFAAEDAHYDLIGFDCCLMADFDVAYALSPFADYYVSSEEVEPGEGWDYENIARELALNPEMSPKHLGKIICENYADFQYACGANSTTTLSLMETDKLESVREALVSYFDAVIESMSDPDTFSGILINADSAKRYAYKEEKDLVDLMRSTAPFLPEEVTDDVIDAVRDAVIYRTQYNENHYNNGVTFYWGIASDARALSSYEKIASVENYIALLDAINYSYHPNPSIYELTDRIPEIDRKTYRVQINTDTKANGFSALKITNGIKAVESITYGIYSTDEAGYKYKISELGNLRVNEKSSMFTPNFDGKIANIDGIPVVLNTSYESNEYTLYNIPVYYEDYLFNLRVVFYPDKVLDNVNWVGSNANGDNGTFEILGIYNDMNNSGTDAADRDVIRLEYGIELCPAYPEMVGVDKTLRYTCGDQFVYGRDTTVEMAPIEDGDYEMAYIVRDVFGFETSSDYLPMQVKNGRLCEVYTAPTAKEDLSQYEVRFNCISKDVYNKRMGINPEDEKKQSKVTVLAYIDGSNLEADCNGFATRSIESLIGRKESEDVNVIFQTGGADKWFNNAVNSDYIQRFEAHEGFLVEADRVPEYNMCTGEALGDFLKWGVENYPADEYVLMMFDHGGAWLGTASDALYDDSLISLNEIAGALEESGVHYNSIVFNCCLMSTLEVAGKLAPYADYLIGSEESIIAIDYSNGEIIDYITEHADNLNPQSLGRFICNTYYDDLEENGVTYLYQSFSSLDLSKVQDVVDAIDEMAVEMTEVSEATEGLTELLRALSKARHYAYVFTKDLSDMVKQTKYLLSDETISDVINAVDELVDYRVSGMDYSRNGGVSIFFQTNMDNSLLDEYATVCPSKKYLAFLDMITAGWHNSVEFYEEEDCYGSVNPLDFKSEYELKQDDDTSASLVLTSELDVLADVSYKVMKYDEARDCYQMIAKRSDVNYDSESKSFSDLFDGRAVTVNGAQCSLEVTDVTPDGIYFKAPVYVEDSIMDLILLYRMPQETEEDAEIEDAEAEDTEEDAEAEDAEPEEDEVATEEGIEQIDNSKISLYEMDFDNGSFEIVGLTLPGDISTGLPSRDSLKLEDGMEITFIVESYNKNGQKLYSDLGESFTYHDGMESDVRLKFLEDGDYFLSYEITDGLQITSESDMIQIIIKNAKISEVIVPEN